MKKVFQHYGDPGHSSPSIENVLSKVEIIGVGFHDA